jgi:flagellar protein FliS
MFGQNSRGIDAYARISVETGVAAANPQRLVVMLYEGALAACNAAALHMQNGNIAEKGAALSKAIMIIESGLRASLDKKAGGEISENLDALYVYMSNRLYIANLKNQPEPIREVAKLLGDFKAAWEAIATPA